MGQWTSGLITLSHCPPTAATIFLPSTSSLPSTLLPLSILRITHSDMHLSLTPPAAITAPISFVCITLFALFTLLIGLRFLLTPTAAAHDFGLPSTQPASNGYVTVKGVRDLFMGVLMLSLAWYRDQRALGLCALWGAAIPAVDGWIAAQAAGGWEWGRAMQHWCGVPAALIMAYSLLSY